MTIAVSFIPSPPNKWRKKSLYKSYNAALFPSCIFCLSTLSLPPMSMQRVPIALQQAVMCCLRGKLQQANQYLATEYPEPAVNYRQRGTSAGSAYLASWEIRLNPVLLLENQKYFIDTVVPHELAHLLVFRQFGRVAPHGSQWRWMMETVLQTPPSRTHQFETGSVQSRTFPYQCDCQQHSLTIRRHNRIQRGENQYHCGHCGEKLSLSIQ